MITSPKYKLSLLPLNLFSSYFFTFTSNETRTRIQDFLICIHTNLDLQIDKLCAQV